MNSEIDIILKTFQNNNIDFSWKGTKVSVDGQDIVLQDLSGNIIRLPFAAQLISMSSGNSSPVFEVTFADGTKLNAGELLGHALKNTKENDGVLSLNKNIKQNDSITDENNDGQNNSTSTVKEKIVEKVVVEKVVIEDNSAIGNTPENTISDIINNQESNIEEIFVYTTKPIDTFSSSASSDENKKFDEQPPDVTQSSGSLNVPDSVSMFQLATEQLFDSNTIVAGGGSRDIFDFKHQYGTQVIDKSSAVTGMTFDATIRGSSDHGNKLTKIISLGDGYTINSFSDENNGLYSIITSNSEQGQQIGLKPGEFAIVYDTAINYDFTIPLSAEKNGVMYDYKLGFRVSHLDNTDSIIDDSGYINLGRTPSPLLIKGTSGDDLFKAGDGNDIYHGGNGSDTITWQEHNTGITVDFSPSGKVQEMLSSSGITSENSAIVNVGSKEQIINGFEHLTGTSYDDNFIISDGSNITISGNGGNDSFIIKGGIFNVDGGDGVNIIDFSGLKNTGKIKESSHGDNHNITVDGVIVNLYDGKVNYSDSQGNKESVVNNVSVVKGTANNDVITGSDRDEVIDGGGGNDIFYGSSGNDVIKGASGSVLDYSNLDGIVNINLTSKVADKLDSGQDTFTAIDHIVGSQGGGHIISDGFSATLSAGGGETNFSVSNGYYTMRGSEGSNNYKVTKSIASITGNGQDNISVENSIFDYDGKLSTNSTLIIKGGQSDITTGSGNTVIEGRENAVIEIHSVTSGDVIYKSHGATVKLWLNEGVKTTLDYSNITSAVKAVLSEGKIHVGDNTDEVISGNISKIIGSNTGNNIIDASNTNTSITVISDGDNNTFISGKGKNNHFEISGVIKNGNILDYSKTDSKIDVDLNNNTIRKSDDDADKAINFNHIKGSTGNGNTFKGKEGIDTTFDVKYGTNQTITAKDTGNDTYILKGGNTDTLDYSKLKTSIIYNQSSGSACITKGNYHDSITNRPVILNGTSQGDTFNISNSRHNLIINAGDGNDVFNINDISATSTYHGNGGINTLNYTGSQTLNFNFTGQHNVNINNNTVADNISSFSHAGNGSATFVWSNGADNINLNIGEHKNGSHFDFIITEGKGNTINGGGNLTETSYSKVDYSNFSQGIVANLSDANSTVKINGNGNGNGNGNNHIDHLTNINAIKGTNFNDIITGGNHKTFFYASGGSDTYNGGNNSDKYISTYQSNLTINDTNVTINKIINNNNNNTDILTNVKEITLSNNDDNVIINNNNNNNNNNNMTINTADGNDIVIFNHSIGNVEINLGAGSDTLKQMSNGSGNITLGNLSNIKNMETLDLSTVNHTKIEFDLNGYFTSHDGKNTLNLKVNSHDAGSKSIFDFKTNGEWTKLNDHNNNHHTYVDSHGHTLVVDVV
ncbi:calcium-binding protein [Salmonella enterica]|uniref:Calcium-binding protein n=1 Tax=Salmonella enterica TaxID=28901 RepID=A0A5U3IUT0_SALER|nr:calcium-binding protein [Salmonella enterica]